MATRFLTIDKEFSATKENPVVIHTWEVWRNHKNEIVCLSHSKATDRRVWKFPFEPGTVGLYNGTHNKYAFFRPKKFQDFLDKFGLTRVVKEDPNRAYEVRQAYYAGGRANANIYTDGKAEVINTDWGESADWTTSAYKCWQKIKVENATFAIVEQYREEYGTRNYAKVLYTLQDIFTLEEKITDTMKKEEEIA